MKSRLIYYLVFLSAFAGRCLIASGSARAVVVDINANKLLSTVSEQLSANLVIKVPQGGLLPVNKDAAPSETISIVRDQDIEARGRLYWFMKDDRRAGQVQLGVFSDHESALAIFEAHLKHTSMGPDKNLTAEFGTNAVAWSVREEGQHLGRILFVRDNVVVSINIPAPGFAESGGSTKVITKLASTIDGALVNGTLGVQRGKTLRVPRIVGLEPARAVPARATIPGQVRISVPQNPLDESSSYTEIVRSHPFHTPRVDSHAKPEGQEEVTYHVTYITPGCVVASKEICVVVQPGPARQP
jgi:hypothetical protein